MRFAHKKLFHPDSSYGQIKKLAQPKSYARAEEILKQISAKEQLKTPAEIFAKKPQERDLLLAEFCKKAEQEGFKTTEIARAILKWSYPHKLDAHKDVTKDQAAGLYAFASTAKVNLNDLFFGGADIVQGKTLLNGVFGKAGTNVMDATDVRAAAHYLTQHDMEHDLPQAPFMAFVGRCGNGRSLEDERVQITTERNKFVKALGHLTVDRVWFKIADEKHGNTVKFRLLCAVFDSDSGKLMVVSDNSKKPAPFSEWVKNNLNGLLSASDTELGKIMEFALRRGGLLEKLRNPASGDMHYHPWSDLLAEIKSADGVTGNINGNEGELYKQAVKVWRYAILQLNLESVQAYEKGWEVRKSVEGMLNADLNLVCDDGRQKGNLKALGAMLTEEEYLRMFVRANPQMGRLRNTPHYGCGFLTAAQGIHHTFETLYKRIAEEYKNDRAKDHKKAEYELDRKIEFFQKRVGMILKGDDLIAEPLTLKDYLPSSLAAPQDTGDEKISKMLFSLFSGTGAPDEKLRKVTKRAVEAGVFEIDKKTGCLHMPAATKTIENLEKLFGEDYSAKFTPAWINALITEEAARQAYEKYAHWSKKQNAKFELAFVMESFQTGQYVEVPPEPRTKNDYLNLTRKDFFLNREFTPDEVKELGLGKFMEWTIPS